MRNLERYRVVNSSYAQILCVLNQSYRAAGFFMAGHLEMHAVKNQVAIFMIKLSNGS